MSQLLLPYLHRVQYYETDQMAIVHHSNYIRWFEEARVDWFEQMGLPFAQVEAMGIQIPVVSCAARYRASARFGDTVALYLTREQYNGVRLTVGYEVREEKTGALLATGQSEHCFTAPTGKILNLRRSHPQVDEVLRREFHYA
jgi:acyl-CoA thioester hydrolase